MMARSPAAIGAEAALRGAWLRCGVTINTNPTELGWTYLDELQRTSRTLLRSVVVELLEEGATP